MPADKPPAVDAARHHVLPVVERICAQINNIFIRFVGPIAPMLCEECFERWSAVGETGPRGLGRYITMLSQHIPTVEHRAAFILEARASALQILKTVQGGVDAAPPPKTGTIKLDI